MKEKLKGLIIGIFIGSIVTSGVTFADGNFNENIIFKKVKYVFDGIEKNSIESILYKGQLYTPANYLTKYTNKDFVYDSKKNTAWIGKKEGSFKYLSSINYSRLDINERTGDFHFDKWNKVPYGKAFLEYTANFNIEQNEYLHGIGFANNNYLSNKGSGSVTYNLKENYKKLTGFVGIDDFSKNNVNIGQIIIYGDKKVIYTSDELKGGNSPKSLNVNIENVKELKIEFKTMGDRYLEQTFIDFTDIKIFQ